MLNIYNYTTFEIKAKITFLIIELYLSRRSKYFLSKIADNFFNVLNCSNTNYFQLLHKSKLILKQNNFIYFNNIIPVLYLAKSNIIWNQGNQIILVNAFKLLNKTLIVILFLKRCKMQTILVLKRYTYSQLNSRKMNINWLFLKQSTRIYM